MLGYKIIKLFNKNYFDNAEKIYGKYSCKSDLIQRKEKEMKMNNKSLIYQLDNNLLSYIKNNMHGHIMDKIMISATFLGNGGIIWILTAIALILNKSYWFVGNVVIITLILSTIIGEGIIKHLVRRIRPCNYENNINLLIQKPVTYSFPSGHTLSSFAVAQVLSTYFVEYKLIFIGIAFTIALSRLYLYVHYPTDIIAGIIIGILCAKLTFLLVQKGYAEEIIYFFIS